MTDLENRLAGALTERVDELTVSPDAWEQNLARLDAVPTASPRRKFRAPLLIAAAVVLLAGSVTLVSGLNGSIPATAPSAAQCGFGHPIPGSTSTIYRTLPSGAVIALQSAPSGAACFFDGIAWTYAPATGPSILSHGIASAAGHSWLWVVTTTSAKSLQFRNSSGATIKPDYALSGASGDDSTAGPGRIYVAVELTGSGSVAALAGTTEAGSFTFDMSAAEVSQGAVVRGATTDPVGGGIGSRFSCPTGNADATADITPAGRTAIKFALHASGIAGEPVICLLAGSNPVGVVPAANLTGGTSLTIDNGLAWGSVGGQTTRVILTMGDTTTTFTTDGANGTEKLARLGTYLVFAVPTVSAKTYSLAAYDSAGKTLFREEFGA